MKTYMPVNASNRQTVERASDYPLSESIETALSRNCISGFL